MTAVVGLDLSLTASGVASCVGLQTIASKPTPDGLSLVGRAIRLQRLVNRVLVDVTRARIEERTDDILVVIEAPSLGQSRQRGELDRHGLWWLVVYEVGSLEGVSIVEVPPATLKKYATGKGNATKPDMRMALFQRAGIDERDDNKVDAWWLRAMGCDWLGQPLAAVPQTHRVALDKVAWPEGLSAA